MTEKEIDTGEDITFLAKAIRFTWKKAAKTVYVCVCVCTEEAREKESYC